MVKKKREGISMDIKKEKISWIENVAKKRTQIDADLDVIVPDSKPDIKKILQIDANVETTTCELQNDRVLLCGNVYFNVIYLPEDTLTLQSIRVTAPFTDIVAINGVNPDMDCMFETDVLSINYKIINGRKFSVKCVIEAVLNIKHTPCVEIVTEITDNAVQIQNDDVNLLKRSARCNKKIDINEKIIVPDSEPAISEVLNLSAKVNEYSVKLINNKAIIKGDIKFTCTYVEAVNNDIVTLNRVAPFTEILDIDGVKTEDLYSARIEIKSCDYNCEVTPSGETRGIETKSSLNVDIFTMRDEKCIIVQDCYATDKELQLTTNDIIIPKKINDVECNDTLKTSVNVGESDPVIERVYDVFSKAYIDDVAVKQDKILLKAIVDNYVLYVTKDEDKPIYCLKNEIEFVKELDCEGCCDPKGDFFAEVLNTSYALSSENSVDLRVNLKINGVICDSKKVNVITDIKTNECKSEYKTASITVYFVQDNETLWDIAKRYFTTIDAIINVNDLSDKDIQKGMRLLIPKYKRI